MNIVFVGTGYVGLVSGTCFSAMGWMVTCVDRDTTRIDRLRRGEIPIYEPGLEALVKANVACGRLRFDTDLRQAATADVIFIAVGTPAREDDGRADLSSVFAAASEIAAAIGKYAVIAIKSTVPVGTAEQVEAIMRRSKPQADFSVVSNPEFLKEGWAVTDFMQPDRIVLGSADERATKTMHALYAPLVARGHKLLVMDPRGAELTKYAANALLATRIAFVNEIADLCERAGTSVADVTHGMGLDRRIGTHFLQAGPGFGGSCFPKDTLSLARTAAEFGVPQRIVETVIRINEQRQLDMGRKVIHALDGARGKRVAVLGLAFKANTDDVRNSPALPVIQALHEQGASVRISDPQALRNAAEVVPDGVICVTDPYEAARDADAVVIATEWPEYRKLDLTRLRTLMQEPLLIDLRNILDMQRLDDAGFMHAGIGRPDHLGHARRTRARRKMIAK